MTAEIPDDIFVLDEHEAHLEAENLAALIALDVDAIGHVVSMLQRTDSAIYTTVVAGHAIQLASGYALAETTDAQTAHTIAVRLREFVIATRIELAAHRQRITRPKSG